MANQYLLQRGDIIRLEKGMRIYVALPEKFVYINTPFSDKLCKHDICIGEVLRRKVPTKSFFTQELVKTIKNTIHYNGVTFEKVSDFVDSLNLDFSSEEFDTSMFVGEYRVFTARSNGGGTNRTLSGGVEHFPDGWHVFCERVDDSETIVDFYQTGCFTAMIPDIKPIRHDA